MARVNLREYLREIDDLIENGRTDEAIAHSRYILELYPKHIETYRLLGKAYLETQRYSDAADVLQRVLSSIPDDFISNLGMSIIREDEGNLDAAIWHMERAFEVQPSNAAIQEELRRLYGRRDGLEPSKIHLTRGALARMYAKGELYEQAIAEINATLAQEPKRTDLQVLLAQLYDLNGQHNDAIRTCTNIIQKYPNCQAANQILADKLQGTERAAEIPNYHKRLQALDPYAAHIPASAPSTDHIPDNIVTLERHKWAPGDAVLDSKNRPDWATSLGVDIGSNPSDNEDLPEWLAEKDDKEITPPFEPGSIDIESISNMDDKNEQPVVNPQAEPGQINHISPQIEDDSDESSESEDQIPEWMQSAGWELSDKPLSVGSEEEIRSQVPLDNNSAKDEDELEPADIPDWLRSISPTSSEPEHPIPELDDESTSDEPVNWLDEKTPGATDSIVTWLQSRDQFEDSDDSDMEPLPAAESISTGSSEESEDNLHPLDELEDPGIDSSLLQDSNIASSDDTPDWLQDIGEETARDIQSGIPMDPSFEVESPDAIEPQDATLVPDENIPEWLRDLGDEGVTVETPKPGEEMVSDISAGTEKPIEESAEEFQEFGVPASIEITPESDGDMEIKPLDSRPTTEDGVQPEIDIPEWLQSLGDENLTKNDLDIPGDLEDTSPEENIQPIHQEQHEDLSEWLENLDNETLEDAPLDPSADQIGKPLEEIEEPELDSQQEDGIPDWLIDLSTESPVDQPHSPSEESEELTVTADIFDESEQTKISGTQEQLEILDSEASADGVAAIEAEPPAEDIPEFLPSLGEEIKSEEAFESEISITSETLMDHKVEIPELGPEDEDAAIAWMESLAEKQGVNEEEFLTTPEDRQSGPPDWVQQLSLQSEPFTPEDKGSLETIKADEMDEKTAQDSDLVFDPSSEISDESTSDVLEEAEEVPEWLQVLMEESTTVDKTPILDEQSADIEASAEVPESPDETVPAWILELAEETADSPTESTIEKLKPIVGDTQPIMLSEDGPELSEDLSSEIESSEMEVDIESTEATFEDQIEAFTLQPFDEAETIPYPESEIPDWIKDSDISKSAQPELEETVEQELESSEWRSPEDLEEAMPPSDPTEVYEAEKAEDESEIPDWIIDDNMVDKVSDTPALIDPFETKVIEDELEVPEWMVDEPLVENEISELFETEVTELAVEHPEPLPELTGTAGEAPSNIPADDRTSPDGEIKLTDWASADYEETGLETEGSIQPIAVEKEGEKSEISEWMEAEKIAEWFEESEPSEPIGRDIPDEIKPVTQPIGEPDIEEIQEAGMSTDSEESPDESETDVLVEDSTPSPVNLNTATFTSLERLPGIGPVLAQTIIDYRETHDGFLSVDSIQEVPGIGSKNIEMFRDYITVETKEEPVSLPDFSEGKILRAGRSALEKSNITKAYDQYSKLIENELVLDQVIDDLKDALSRYPVEVSIYELLGDAYVRTDQLQEAIETYTKAEELLN
jgi:competence ComEA-like helix-hairpin-helix protein